MNQISFADCCFISIPKEGYRLTWETTQYCPYSCEYCFTWSSPRREKFESDISATMSKLQTLIDNIQVQDVLITGGEPLSVLNEITPFLQFLNRKNISFSFSSNLFDKSLLPILARYSPRAINISIDPPLKINERSSFKSLYNKIEEKLDFTELKGIPIKLTSVITKKNYKGVYSLLDFLSNVLKKYPTITKIAFNREYPIGFAAESLPQTKSDLDKTFKLIKKWAKKTSVPVTLVNWDVFHSPLQECPAGKKLISVMPNADVSPCSLLYNLTKSFRIGNLLKDPLKEILDRLDIFNYELEKYKQLSRTNTPKCNICEKSNICGGGCPAMLPIASNHISRRSCSLTPRRVKDHERIFLAEIHHNFHIDYSPDLRTFCTPKSELSKEIENKISNYIRNNLRPSDLAHTMEHIECVVNLTKFISKKEGASPKITIPAAYFHDVSPREPAMHYMHTFKSSMAARDFLEKTGFFTEEELVHIQYCIYTSSWGSYLLGYYPLSLEAKVLRDADWLDAIGARGIARVFAFAQAHGAKSFGYPDIDPEGFLVSIDMNITGPDKNPIYHFYTKLLKIYPLLQTPTAQKIGRERHQTLVNFLNEYRKESDTGKMNFRQLEMKFNKIIESYDNK